MSYTIFAAVIKIIVKVAICKFLINVRIVVTSDPIPEDLRHEDLKRGVDLYIFYIKHTNIIYQNIYPHTRIAFHIFVHLIVLQIVHNFISSYDLELHKVTSLKFWVTIIDNVYEFPK